jgi:2,4-dienoyl-CoA reductase-like NADH-dependent reductase (Old Yellow Enzyme family)/thioredoxin reductase
MKNDFAILFQTIEIGRGRRRLRLKNRFVMPPMVTCMANTLGEVTQRMVDYYSERARGGVGLIIVESMDVDDKMLFNRLGIFHDRFINELNYLAASIKEGGARAFGQINETGLRGNLPGPDELSPPEIENLIQAYAAAADRLKRAEFDGVEIHGAHGYLINQFLSPLTNHRKDQYGGGREERARFAQAVIQAVRKTVGEDFPISFRMNGDDFLAGGVRIEDARVTARIAEEAGADLIHVSGGVGIVAHDLSLGDNKSYFHMIQPMYLPRGCLIHLAADVKTVVKVPVITVGRINDPILARDILAQGKADLVALGRQLIADPNFPKKVAEGRMEDIRQCMACNYCHGRRMRAIKHVHCAVNPWAGREAELRNIKPAEKPKKVLIVGAGPAGMEASRWLKRRGHRPVLYEKSDRLGGGLWPASLPPHKEEIETFRQFLARQIGKMGIPANLSTGATPELILQEKPDTVIIAAGAKPLKPDFPIDREMVYADAGEILSGKRNIPGDNVFILGGGFVAAEVAEFMAGRGKNVTMVEMRDLIAFDMEPSFRQMLIARLQQLGVRMITRTRVQEVTRGGVLAEDLEREEVREFPADGVVIALGAEPVEFPVERLEQAGIPVRVIGDAREVQGIAEAVRDGFLAGISV